MVQIEIVFPEFNELEAKLFQLKGLKFDLV